MPDSRNRNSHSSAVLMGVRKTRRFLLIPGIYIHKRYAFGETMYQLAAVAAVTYKSGLSDRFKAHAHTVTYDTMALQVSDLDLEDFCRIFTPIPIEKKKGVRAILELTQHLFDEPPARRFLERMIEKEEDLPSRLRQDVKVGKNEFYPCGPGPKGTDHSCIVIEHTKKTIIFVTLYDMQEIGSPRCLRLLEATPEEFNQWYKRADYPAERLAEIYLQFGITLGATPKALSALGRFIHIFDYEFDQAVRVYSDAQPIPEEKVISSKNKLRNGPVVSGLSGIKAARATRKPEHKKETAAQLFRELLLDGELTDDEIFKRVQKKFGLDGKKRSYVTTYRRQLVKKGLLKG